MRRRLGGTCSRSGRALFTAHDEVRLGVGIGHVLDLFARNLLTNNLPHGFLQYFVPSSTGPLKGWVHLNIRNNANALGGSFVRVENADTADHRAQATRQGKW